MTEGPSWSDLAANAQETYPNAHLEDAIIAATEPPVLQAAVGQVIVRSHFTGRVLERANEVYDHELSRSDQRSTSPGLYEAARGSIEAEEQHKPVRALAELATRVDLRRIRLSRPTRVAATLLSALALGGGPAGFIGYEFSQEHNKPGQIAISSGSQHKAEGALGLLGGIAGLELGYFSSHLMLGSIARRRARRIVAKTADQAKI